ncbi:uncharacterized protein LOC128723034 [Anopheles nili]|uniref:uncharacterized protein LOC128723034 n=1 Tax=Anopheles nili TaxID=185578 RepID=UPI00237B674D|nr:uncharacterized protein LOC128723034 [Anopheles nili]
MPSTLGKQLLFGAIMTFFMMVILFLSYALVIHEEKVQVWNIIQNRGAQQFTRNGTANYWYYVVRDMDKIANMTDALHLDRTTHVIPTKNGFNVLGKDFEIHFDRINAGNGGETEEDGSHVKEDFMPTLVKRKTYVWEFKRRQHVYNISIPVVVHEKHEKLGTPPFQNAIPPLKDSDKKH